MSSKLSTFICQNCGTETSQYFGKCLNCNSWNSIVEEIKSKRSRNQEIRNNKITREEGVQLVRKFDEEFPQKYFKDFLEYISLTESEFHSILDKFRSPHLWEKVDGEWVLKHAVWHNQERLK